MPTYQYQCTDCGAALEIIQSFSDDSLTECPECAGRLRKVFNAVGVVFKGSGFYRNDSRSTSTSTDAAKSEPSKNGSSTSESSSKESSKKEPSKTGSSSTSTTTSAPTGG
ncbi:MAG: FmdB family zinc ribbon protein [Aeromicrobium sp.]